MNFVKSDTSLLKLKNSDILKDFDQKLSHLSSDNRLELKQVILEYEHLFLDIPSRPDKIYHDVEIIDGSKPVKQHPYRMNPAKQHILSEDVEYLLDNDLIEPVKVNGVLVFLYQNLIGHFACVRTTVK